MPKLRNGKITKPVKPKQLLKKVSQKKGVERERCLNDMIHKAEKDAKEKIQTKFKHKDIFDG
tara:strand:- start:2139 stop:2324 length:186 start_codon:yes stop_codon:yes gene_type:complete